MFENISYILLTCKALMLFSSHIFANKKKEESHFNTLTTLLFYKVSCPHVHVATCVIFILLSMRPYGLMGNYYATKLT